MRHKTTNALYTYWDELRAGRLAPLRTELEPADISALLPNAFVLERSGRDHVRFRLAGEAVCDLIGIELNGMAASALWDDDSRGRVTQLVEGVVSAPAYAVAVGDAEDRGAIKGATVEFSFLPLRTEGGSIDRIIGAAALLSGDAVWRGSEPRLFHLLDMRLTAIQSDVEDADGPADYIQPSSRRYPAAAEEATPFELKAIDGKFAKEERAPVTTLDRARGHLRVVKDDE